MRLADRIRQYALEKYVEPARHNGRSDVTIRAGDVHSDMKLTSRMPAVCGALSADKFLVLARLELLKRTGPGQGANAVFHYRVLYHLPQSSVKGKSPKTLTECKECGHLVSNRVGSTCPNCGFKQPLVQTRADRVALMGCFTFLAIIVIVIAVTCAVVITGV